MKYASFFYKLSAPYLFAILAVTSYWAQNSGRIPLDNGGPSVLYAMAIASLFLVMFWVTPQTGHSYTVAATIGTFFFLFWNAWPWPFNLYIIAGGAVFCTWEECKRAVRNVSLWLPIFLCVAIGVTLIHGALMRSNTHVTAQDYTLTPGQRNIYFIIPDRMPSPAAMAESGIDYSEATAALQELGFMVPEDMLSSDPYTPDYGDVSTTRTMRFFGAALNGEAVDIDISYSDLRQKIKDPELFKELHQQGYEITNVGSWFSETNEFPTADNNLRFSDVSFMEHLFYNEFSTGFYNRSLLSKFNIRAWESDASISSVESERHSWQYYTILDLGSHWRSSQFVISHILLPHEPFIYTESSDQMQQYLDQIDYTLDYIVGLATELRRLDPLAFIVIQSDEGMAFHKPKSINEGLSNTQWNGVFSAWYLPEDVGDLSGIEHYEILNRVINR